MSDGGLQGRLGAILLGLLAGAALGAPFAPARIAPPAACCPATPPVAAAVEPHATAPAKDCPEGRGFFYSAAHDERPPLPHTAHIVPHFERGRAMGFRHYGIRPGTLLAELGFRSGDVFVTIAGIRIDSPDAALEAYERVRELERFEVELLRRGEPLTVVLEQPCGAPPRAARAP